ncbi:MAG: cadherin-like beta sandwich domain-containing protein, partial [Chloroflexi bacterium]|nr:cadherin-like beta sandwich domain-containing protein [Chloroflexota bacterium]
IWSDGAVMYVADAHDDRVYSYNMPDAIDARLASLTLAGVDFGEFSPARTEYEGGAETGAEEATVEAVPAQAVATVVIEPADADAAVAGHQVALEGLDEITVTVTSQDGTRTRVYRVALAGPEELAVPSDARLASLTLSGVDIGAFDPARTGYDGVIGEGVTATVVTAEAARDGASVAIEPPDADGDPANGHEVALEGLEEITVTVTSEDGTRMRVYRVELAGDAIDARLGSLELSGVEIGAFDPARTGYDGVIGEGITETTATAEPAQSGAEVVIEPADADEAAAGHQVALEGLEEITVTVTSEDGTRTRVYRVELGGAAEEPWAHCLKGAVAEGFSLLVYEGGSVADLVACAESRGVTALYAVHGGEWAAHILGAPDFVNRAFAERYPDGVPALTPLVAASEGPGSGDPVGELAAPDDWPACLHGEVAVGLSLVLYEGGSVEELAACAGEHAVDVAWVLDGGDWVGWIAGAPGFVNRRFSELYADGLCPLTPLVVRSERPPPAAAPGSGGDN